MAAGIVREATSIKQAYLAECAFLRYCFSRGLEEPARLFVRYVNKEYVRTGVLDHDALFVDADVTRRVDRIYGEHERNLDDLREALEEDPLLVRYAESECRHPHSCTVCSTFLDDVDENHVSTLYRGGKLVRDLMGEGITSILEIPPSRLVHPRQHIQKRSLEKREPQIDYDALAAFLGRLQYPLHHLDFEAVTMAVPPFDGVRPWEHVPYLYSIHREEHPDAEPTHSWFMMTPGVDQRHELVDRLLADVGETGSIVVYNASFESGILARLAACFPDRAGQIDAAIRRIVDLLAPFNEFIYYSHRQRGKVSLKTVLPILTGFDYDDESIHDGYTANLAYRSLCEGYLKESTDRILQDLVAYCAMDTKAMVEVIRKLGTIAGRGTGTYQPRSNHGADT